MCAAGQHRPALQECFRTPTSSYYRGAQGIIIGKQRVLGPVSGAERALKQNASRQERFRTLTSSCYRGAQGIIFGKQRMLRPVSGAEWTLKQNASRQERFRTLTSSYYRGAQGIIFGKRLGWRLVVQGWLEVKCSGAGALSAYSRAATAAGRRASFWVSSQTDGAGGQWCREGLEAECK